MPDNLFAKGVAKSWELYAKDVGKSLIHWGSVGWVFSSLAQIFAIAINKNIDKKEKKFLIPQEIADGAVNVGLYYTITQSIKSLGDSLVETGGLIKKDTADFLSSVKDSSMSLKEFIKDKGNITTILAELKSTEKIDSKTAVNAAESFARWKNGIGTIFTIAASVLACNVITPYCRNRIASVFQQHHIEKEKISALNKTRHRIVHTAQLPDVFHGFRI